VAVDGDRIYTVGESNGDVAVIARKANGAYDTTFSGDGRRDISISDGKDVGVAIVVLPDHRLRILASLDADNTSSTNTDVALVGLKADGTDDVGFGDGDDARITFPVGPIDDSPSRLALGPTGQLAVVGWWKDAGGKEDMFVSLRDSDGAAVPTFGNAGIKRLDRAGNLINDRGIDVAFRPNGGLLTLLQVATSADTNVNNYIAVLHAFDALGNDDTTFSGDGDLILTVGDPNTIPGGLLLYGGKVYATGSTKGTSDTDAFLARTEADGSGLVSRRFDMRGSQIPSSAALVSGGGDLDVLPGPEGPTLVVVGSTTYNSRTFWSAAGFTGFAGDLAQAGYGDVLIPTDEYGALLGVSPGDGFLAATGSLLNVNGNFDTSFGTIKLLVGADRRCDLTMQVAQPLELIYDGFGGVPATLRVTNTGTRACGGQITVPAPYALRGGPIATGAVAPGGTFTVATEISYSGPRRADDVLSVRVDSAEDGDATDNAAPINVLFRLCDLTLERSGSAARAPTEGGRRFEFTVRNVGSGTCRGIRLGVADGGKRIGAADRYTLERGRSATDEMRVKVAPGGSAGERVQLRFRVASDNDLFPENDFAGASPRLIEVGDSDARAAGARRFSGRASRGHGPAKARSLRVARVEIALKRLGGKCRWLRSDAPRLKRDGCGDRHWLRASGRRHWRYTLDQALPPGDYVLFTRAVLRSGYREGSFSAADRNKVKFSVG
jgi:hypothetical protein